MQVCTVCHVCAGICGNQKWASGSLELEYQAVVSLLWLWVLGRAATLFTTEPPSLELSIMNFRPLGTKTGSRTGLGADPQQHIRGPLSLSLLLAPGCLQSVGTGHNSTVWEPGYLSSREVGGPA